MYMRGLPRRRTFMMFHVVLKKDEEGWIVAECPALPGCFSQGKTEQEALTNVKEAITAWLWAEDQKAASALPADQAPVVVAV
jgi:predicted RNase H-like HicB family nuclease